MIRHGLAIVSVMIAATGRTSPLFEDTAVLDIELRGPIESLVRSRESREELDFEIKAGAERVGVKVRVRGNSRARVCSFPPVRLNFSAGLAEDSVFQGQNHLKLVTHCTLRKRDANNVPDEYLAYRIFNLISETGYRVRLARVTYVDTDEPDLDEQTRFGFFIESGGELAERTGLTPLRVPGVAHSRIDQAHAARVFIFHYLIGNTDWSLVTALSDEFCCHNGDLFERDGAYFLVPYDFDLSGLVDASYARPDATLPIRSVRSRVYRGYCVSREVSRAALRHIRELRPAVRRLAESIPATDARDLAERVRYIEIFFAATAEEERTLKGFEKRCL